MPYGLKDTEWQVLQSLFAANRRIEQVVLYGSRAKGCHKPFSDVDLVLVGKRLSRTDVGQLCALLDESPLPYQFDVSLLSGLKHAALVDHIHRRGIVIYQR